MILNGMNRAPATLLGAGAAGVLLWYAAQFHRGSLGGYWAAYGIVAAAGFVFALLQMRGRTGHPPAMLLVAFVPVLIVAGWVIVALQPVSTTTSSHVLGWSSDIGVADVVRSVGTWLGVLAFGIGYVLGAALEPPAVRRRRAVAERPAPASPAAVDRAATDEPTAAERREVAEAEPARRRYPAPR